MSDNKSNSSRSRGFGALGLFGIVGAVVAWWTTPAFTFAVAGWAGLGKALLVGAGTSMGGSIVGLPLAIAGAVVLGVAGAIMIGKKAGVAGALVGAFLAGVTGGIYGAVQGYKFSKDALTPPCTLTEKASKISFNAAAQPASYADAFKGRTVTFQQTARLG